MVTVWVGVFPLAITPRLTLAATLYITAIFGLLFRVRAYRCGRHATAHLHSGGKQAEWGCVCRHFQCLYFAGERCSPDFLAPPFFCAGPGPGG